MVEGLQGQGQPQAPPARRSNKLVRHPPPCNPCPSSPCFSKTCQLSAAIHTANEINHANKVKYTANKAGLFPQLAKQQRSYYSSSSSFSSLPTMPSQGTAAHAAHHAAPDYDGQAQQRRVQAERAVRAARARVRASCKSAHRRKGGGGGGGEEWRSLAGQQQQGRHRVEQWRHSRAKAEELNRRVRAKIGLRAVGGTRPLWGVGEHNASDDALPEFCSFIDGTRRSRAGSAGRLTCGLPVGVKRPAWPFLL